MLFKLCHVSPSLSPLSVSVSVSLSLSPSLLLPFLPPFFLVYSYSLGMQACHT